MAESEIFLLARLIGAVGRLGDAFPKIVINCCLQLLDSQSGGCSARNSCSRSAGRGSTLINAVNRE